MDTSIGCQYRPLWQHSIPTLGIQQGPRHSPRFPSSKCHPFEHIQKFLGHGLRFTAIVLFLENGGSDVLCDPLIDKFESSITHWVLSFPAQAPRRPPSPSATQSTGRRSPASSPDEG